MTKETSERDHSNYYDEGGSRYMENPFSTMELRNWPDFLLIVAGLSFLASLFALLSGVAIASTLTVLMGGLLFFALGGKMNHYRFRDDAVKGNSNAWFSGWRHGFLGNTFAGVGLLLIGVGLFQLLWT